jgi:hypothetical protein
MKKMKKTPAEKKTMPIPPWPGGGPRPPFPPGRKLGGYLILKPETWKKINEIAADPEKYMYGEDEHSGNAD